MTSTIQEHYDRSKEVKEFDDSKIGVKGLVDSGVISIPRFFHHPPHTLPNPKSVVTKPSVNIPVIDFSNHRSIIVEEIKQASSQFGFFQVINHGVPQHIIDRAISTVRSFYEQSAEEKARFYHRDITTGVAYSANYDLLHSKAASWRDTIQIRLGPDMPDPDLIPEMCREMVVEWAGEILRLGEVVMGMLCEGLGLEERRLEELTCQGRKVMVGHYYPYCPEPDLTAGLSSHTDPDLLTVLIQDQVGGLQINYGGEWVDVQPHPGAVVINIGDVLQVLSNDEYKSVEHRVLANPNSEPRISIAVLINPGTNEMLGPLQELISPEKPALYRNFIFADCLKSFFARELESGSLRSQYKI